MKKFNEKDMARMLADANKRQNKITQRDAEINLDRQIKRTEKMTIAPKLTIDQKEVGKRYIKGEITLKQRDSLLGIDLCTTHRFSFKQEEGNTKARKNSGKCRVEVDLCDSERIKLGLVTTKRPNISYLLAEDNTKFCRCCNKRKPAPFFSNHKATKDGKMAICKDCDYTRGVTYKAHKKAQLSASN
jgi:hypothetical protein